MFILHVSPWNELPPPQREAVIALTVERYVEAVHLPAYLAEACGLAPGSTAYEQARIEHVAAIERSLRAPDPQAWVLAILHPAEGGGWTALGAIQALRGRGDVPLAQSIGSPHSSLPTHTLLQGFAYPRHGAAFDAEQVTEAAIFESTRLVVASKAWVAPLVRSGAVSAETVQSLLAAAAAELVLASTRLAHRLSTSEPMAGWIFNVRPRLAVALRERIGLDLQPLFAGGVAPTPQALDSPLDAPYFHHWRHQLCQGLPAEVLLAVDREGPAAAVRHLAQQDYATWQEREVTLPFLVADDTRFRRALDRLEAGLAQQPYTLQRSSAHAR